MSKHRQARHGDLQRMAPAGFRTWSEHVPAPGLHAAVQAVKLQVSHVTAADAGAAAEGFFCLVRHTRSLYRGLA
jgi:hypothetical protein